MWKSLQYAGARRLWVAAGLSVVLHAAIVVSVQRPSAGTSALPFETSAQPLIARLATAVSDAVLPVVTTPEVTPETGIAPLPAPINTSPASPPRDMPAETGIEHYFKATELDRRPFPLTRIEIQPPESTGVDAGSVMIRLRISESGRVDEAKIVIGTGITEFETTALREFSRTRFHPGYRDNLAVRSEMLIEVTLRPPMDNHKKSRAEPALRKE